MQAVYIGAILGGLVLLALLSRRTLAATRMSSPISKHVGGTVSSDATIVVVVPSFACRHLTDTILGAYTSAADPTRVHVAVLECTGTSDPADSQAGWVRSRLEAQGLVLWATNVKWAMQDSPQGPVHARALALQNYSPYTYALHVHAHTSFERGWDATLIQAHEREAARHPGRPVVFTTYPSQLNTTFLAFQPKFHTYGLPASRVLSLAGVPSGVELRSTMSTALWTSRFSFAPAGVHSAVPFDAGLRVLSDCEDVVYAARLHAYGAVLQHPPVCPLVHAQDHANSQCGDVWAAFDAAPLQEHKQLVLREGVSRRRLLCQLGMLVLRDHMLEMRNLPRTLTQAQLDAYCAYAGIDMARRSVSPAAAAGLTSSSCASEVVLKTGVVP